jgi:DNA-binding FadR family transcriptional regulator
MSCSISASSGAVASAQSNPFRQRAADMQALGKALESGDLDAAKEAFARLAANPPPPPRQAAANADDKVKSAFDTLAKALQDGDTDGAKQAFSDLQDAMKTARAAHGHGHHHKKDASSNAEASLSLMTTGFSITA